MEFRQPLKDKIGYGSVWRSKVPKYLRKTETESVHFFADISKQVLKIYILFHFKIGLCL